MAGRKRTYNDMDDAHDRLFGGGELHTTTTPAPSSLFCLDSESSQSTQDDAKVAFEQNIHLNPNSGRLQIQTATFRATVPMLPQQAVNLRYGVPNSAGVITNVTLTLANCYDRASFLAELQAQLPALFTVAFISVSLGDGNTEERITITNGSAANIELMPSSFFTYGSFMHGLAPNTIIAAGGGVYTGSRANWQPSAYYIVKSGAIARMNTAISNSGVPSETVAILGSYGFQANSVYELTAFAQGVNFLTDQQTMESVVDVSVWDMFGYELISQSNSWYLRLDCSAVQKSGVNNQI